MPKTVELEICLAGRLRIVGSSGEEVLVRGRKARAIVVLLATAPGFVRPRAFLQDKLWSMAEPERGAANLRQTLTELRRDLGEHRPALITPDEAVAFDVRCVRVRLDPSPGDFELSGEPPELAAGVDVEDPEFEDWIREQRAAYAMRLDDFQPVFAVAAPQVSERTRPVLILTRTAGGDPTLQTLADMVSAEVGFRVARIGDAEVWDGDRKPDASVRAICFDVRVVTDGASARLQALVRDAHRGTLLWSALRQLEPSASTGHRDDGLGRLINELTFALARILGEVPPGATDAEAASVAAYQALACSNLLSPGGLIRADGLLAKAAETHPRATLDAWRALIKGWQVIERVAPAREGGEEAIALARQALDADPLDPVVLTVAAELTDLRVRPFDALAMAQRAVDLDPTDAFAAAGLAKALMRAGETRKAHVAALRACRLATGHGNAAWWTMLCCVTAVHCGRYAEALQHANLAHNFMPTFHPPLRFLIGLRFHAGDEEGVADAAMALKRLEPDFSRDALLDPDYPLRLGGTPLLAVASSGLF